MALDVQSLARTVRAGGPGSEDALAQLVGAVEDLQALELVSNAEVDEALLWLRCMDCGEVVARLAPGVEVVELARAVLEHAGVREGADDGA